VKTTDQQLDKKVPLISRKLSFYLILVGDESTNTTLLINENICCMTALICGAIEMDKGQFTADSIVVPLNTALVHLILLALICDIYVLLSAQTLILYYMYVLLLCFYC